MQVLLRTHTKEAFRRFISTSPTIQWPSPEHEVWLSKPLIQPYIKPPELAWGDQAQVTLQSQTAPQILVACKHKICICLRACDHCKSASSSVCTHAQNSHWIVGTRVNKPSIHGLWKSQTLDCRRLFLHASFAKASSFVFPHPHNFLCRHHQRGLSFFFIHSHVNASI